MKIPLEQPWFLLFIPFGVVAVWRLVRQKGVIGFSTPLLLEGIKTQVPFLFMERLFLGIFVAVGMLILARPTELIKNSVPVYQEARDITLVLDTSGSMSGTSIETAKRVISEFVAGRPQDRIALMVFDSRAFLEWPLSPDHQPLLYRIDHVTTGDGTIIATGLIAALQHLAQYGQNPGAVIMVSDGGSDVSSKEKSTIEHALGKTKLYWIWIGSQADELAQAFGDYVERLGGKVYKGEVRDLGAIFSEISQLEASPVVWEQHIATVYNFGVLPLVALCSLLGAGLLEMFREV